MIRRRVKAMSAPPDFFFSSRQSERRKAIPVSPEGAALKSSGVAILRFMRELLSRMIVVPEKDGGALCRLTNSE